MSSKFGKRVNRGSLSTKQLPHCWYKGKGVRPVGKLDQHGRFILNRAKLINFHVPNLEGFELKPYVSYNSPLVKCLPPVIPKDFKEIKKKALEELKIHENLYKTFPQRMRNLVQEAKLKAKLEVNATKVETQENNSTTTLDPLNAEQELLVFSEKRHYPKLYVGRLEKRMKQLEIQNRREIKKMENITAKRKERRKVRQEKRRLDKERAEERQSLTTIPKSMKMKKSFFKPARKGKAINKVVGIVEKKIVEDANKKLWGENWKEVVQEQKKMVEELQKLRKR